MKPTVPKRPLAGLAKVSDNTAMFKAYQTPEDRARQYNMVSILARLWNFTPSDRGQFDVVDYDCYRNGQLVALLEIKSKFCNFADYDTYLCTTKDIDEGLALSEEHGVPFVLAVKWSDFWGYLKVTHNDYKSRRSGQMNRNDPNDYMAWCYLIPMSEFKEVKYG